MERAENELLAFWKDTLPLDVLRLYQKLLPGGVELPGDSVNDADLLTFYQRLVPKRVRTVLMRVLELPFPIVDVRQLAEHLGGSGKQLDAIGRDILSAVRAADMPLTGLRPALDIVSMRTLSQMFAGCWQSYNDCRRSATLGGGRPPASALAKCENAYQACADEVSLQIFVNLTAGLWRPVVPSHWKPWWPGPMPDPEPPWRW